MSSISNRVPNFSVGINRLLPALEGADHKLPERAALAPTGQPLRLNIDDLLRQPSVQQQVLLDFLKPDVRNAFILTPARYHALLDSARQSLLTLADGGEDTQRLSDGANLIEQEQLLRELLANQRHALLGA